VKRLI